MKHTKTLLAFAAIAGLAVTGLSQSYTPWFNFNFDGVAFAQLTNTAYTAGTWAAGDGDMSDIEAYDGTRLDVLKLNTQGTDLTFTAAARSTDATVLIDTDVYLVASDSEPSGFDLNSDVQTAVFLKNLVDTENDDLVTNAVLCAYVETLDNEGKGWVELTGDFSSESWYSLSIVITYGESGDPIAEYSLNGVALARRDGSNDPLVIANAGVFATANRGVQSVSFRGTGFVDSFIGQTEAAATLPDVTFDAMAYTDSGADATFPAVFDYGSSWIVSQGTPFTGKISLTWFDTAEDPAMTFVDATVIRIVYQGTRVEDYDVTCVAGVYTITDSTGAVAANIIPDATEPFAEFTVNTTGLSGSVSIEIYYGTTPGVVPTPTDDNDPIPYSSNGGIDTLPILTIGGGYDDITLADEDKLPIEFVDGNFVVRLISAGTGVTYTLQEVTTIADGFVGATEGTPVSGVVRGEVVTLSAPVAGSKPNAFYRVKATWVDAD